MSGIFFYSENFSQQSREETRTFEDNNFHVLTLRSAVRAAYSRSSLQGAQTAYKKQAGKKDDGERRGK